MKAALHPAAAGLLLALATAGCAGPPAATGWPADLRIVGDGWPRPGDPCRVIGETAATVDLLDHGATLVGCRSGDDAAALAGGRTVGTIGGVTLVSVPARAAGDGDGRGDATVAGTTFHATAVLGCARFRDAGPTLCEAGVRRHGPGGTATVVVLWPGGDRRVLLFDRDARPIGAEPRPGETAVPAVSGTRVEDTTVVTVGQERYDVPDVFVLGD
ncbi:MAG: hypothetical protein ACK5WM_23560 [Rhodospirillales bacterium]